MLDWSLLHGPLPVVIGVAGALAALSLATAAWRAGSRRALVAAAAVVAVGAAASGVNHYYGEVPTIRTALGLGYADQVEFASVPARAKQLVPMAGWSPPAGMPATGRVAQIDVPGTVSGFDARPGWVYLPPAYLGGVRAQLPVLVLLGGQPGGPSDWLDGGLLPPV